MIWRTSSRRHRRLDAEQELQEAEHDERDEGAGRAGGERQERGLRVADGLAQAAGEVADDDVDERRDAERLQQRDVDEQARPRSP